MLAHYRRLIALRHEEPVVAIGRFAMLLPDHEEVYAFTRSLGDDVLLVVCNLSRTPHKLDDLLPESRDADLVLGNLESPTPRCGALGGPGAAPALTRRRGKFVGRRRIRPLGSPYS